MVSWSGQAIAPTVGMRNPNAANRGMIGAVLFMMLEYTPMEMENQKACFYQFASLYRNELLELSLRNLPIVFEEKF